jgi:hypothetical protein
LQSFNRDAFRENIGGYGRAVVFFGFSYSERARQPIAVVMPTLFENLKFMRLLEVNGTRQTNRIGHANRIENAKFTQLLCI